MAVHPDDSSSPEGPERELAIAMYTSGKISLGRAARMCKLGRWEFESMLIQRQIPIIQITLDQLNEDLRPFEP